MVEITNCLNFLQPYNGLRSLREHPSPLFPTFTLLMHRGILFIAVLALVLSGLVNACRRPADEQNLRKVDSLITTIDAAIFTLNELDPGRFDRAHTAFAEREPLFKERFADTLDRRSAELLGDQYLALQASGSMATDHVRTLQELAGAAERLRTLRQDIGNAAMNVEEERTAIGTEEQVHELLQANVQRTIQNYRTIQEVWEKLPATDSLLTAGDPIAQN